MTDAPVARAAEYDVELVRNVAIPVGDDELAADVLLPVGAPPGPALVTLLPYLKPGMAGVAQWGPAKYFAERGYAGVLIDFRGRGSSRGRTRPPFDGHEADDGVAAVEW